jgi:hypothetical protein
MPGRSVVGAGFVVCACEAQLSVSPRLSVIERGSFDRIDIRRIDRRRAALQDRQALRPQLHRPEQGLP